MPNSRPRIHFNENGICNGCLNSKEKDFINWDAREKEFNEIIDKQSSEA